MRELSACLYGCIVTSLCIGTFSYFVGESKTASTSGTVAAVLIFLAFPVASLEKQESKNKDKDS
ncbi:MAG: hypothetical protein WCJ33_08465 [Pseudomonadota bacterium]